MAISLMITFKDIKERKPSIKEVRSMLEDINESVHKVMSYLECAEYIINGTITIDIPLKDNSEFFGRHYDDLLYGARYPTKSELSRIERLLKEFPKSKNTEDTDTDIGA